MFKIILLISLFLSATIAKAETIIIPVQDIIIEIPNYESPKFNLGSAINGQYSIGEIKKSKRDKKILERKIINIMYDQYPDAKNIKIINGILFITLP